MIDRFHTRSIGPDENALSLDLGSECSAARRNNFSTLGDIRVLHGFGPALAHDVSMYAQRLYNAQNVANNQFCINMPFCLLAW